jgi:hypothetical protein
VFRLHKPLTPERLELLNHKFFDILVDGKFEQSGPLEEEVGEEELADMPRLSFHFDRRQLGRLRMLINFVNE